MKKTAACPTCQGRNYLIERHGEVAVARACACSRPCRHCGGLGHVYVNREEAFSQKVGKRSYEVLAPCSCRILDGRIERFAEVRLPGVFSHAGFENFRPSNPAQDHALNAAKAFAYGYAKQKPSRGVILSGPVGSGKSHLLAAALTHLVLEAGARASYTEISLLYATIRRGFQEGKSGGEIIQPLSEVEVLAIDELGRGRGSPFELETMDELIARRYNAGRVTLFATNYSLDPERRPLRASTSEELKAAGKDAETLRERVGERIYSRLCEMCEFIEMPKDTPDRRRTQAELNSRARPHRHR